MRLFGVLFPLILLPFGCDKPRFNAGQGGAGVKPIPPDDVSNGPRFTVKGTITWSGEAPAVPNLPDDFGKAGQFGPPLNPYYPKIDPATRGLANAVVYVALGENWNPGVPKGEVGLTYAAGKLGFGKDKSPIAVASVGSSIVIDASAEKTVGVKARGASFFSLSFPKDSPPRKQSLDAAGIVDFCEANSDFWAASRLHVFDHPWFAITNEKGEFEIRKVPLGNHRLIVEVADWRLENFERDPESQRIARLLFKAPVRKEQPLGVNKPSDVKVEVGEKDFK